MKINFLKTRSTIFFIFIFIISSFLSFCSDERKLELHPHDLDLPLTSELVYRFNVNIDVANPNIEEDKERILNDKGLLILPKGYSREGLPVKLVIYCHGGGGVVTASTSESESSIYCKYLASLGYAILDMNGIPQFLSDSLKIDPGRTVGNFVALRSYIEGYNYVVNNFNIDDTGCYVFSNSNGGLIGMNLVNLTSIPIIAQSGINPMVSIERNLWHYTGGALNISEGGFKVLQNRANIIRLYGMNDVRTQNELNDAIYEKDKVGIYDPFDYLMNIYEKDYRCPYKIFQTMDDKAVNFSITKELVETMQERGDKMTLREITTGGHEVEPQAGVVGIFKYQFIDNKLTPTVLEVAQWFEFNKGYKVFFFN